MHMWAKLLTRSREVLVLLAVILNHWQDVLLHFGSHSRQLRDVVAELIRLFANSIIDFSMIRALMANCLIALDKSPGFFYRNR